VLATYFIATTACKKLSSDHFQQKAAQKCHLQDP
jgi:hypothetical protein